MLEHGGQVVPLAVEAVEFRIRGVVPVDRGWHGVRPILVILLVDYENHGQDKQWGVANSGEWSRPHSVYPVPNFTWRGPPALLSYRRSCTH